MKFICLISLFMLCITGLAMEKKIELLITRPTQMDLIVCIDLNSLFDTVVEKFTLFKLNANNEIAVRFQIDKSKIIWMVEGPVKEGKLEYVIKTNNDTICYDEYMNSVLHNGNLTIQADSVALLNYHYETMYPAEGINPAFKRSAFIHPLWTPHGQILTRIQAPDHYHHYGIWNPWTRVLYKGDTIDFWNLGDMKGTIRFAKFLKIINGPIFSEYEAFHEHVVFKNGGTEEVALNELQKIRVYRPNLSQYIVDITINYSCATDSAIEILEYRYAGLSWRATEEWDKDNSSIITSEGKTRKDADGSLARWFIIQGTLGNDYGGMMVMSCPDNYNHPEPLRIWPEDMNNRGDVFANFAPTKNKNWLFETNKTYTLKYRFIVFNGSFTTSKAQNAWMDYTLPINIIETK